MDTSTCYMHKEGKLYIMYCLESAPIKATDTNSSHMHNERLQLCHDRKSAVHLSAYSWLSPLSSASKKGGRLYNELRSESS